MTKHDARMILLTDHHQIHLGVEFDGRVEIVKAREMDGIGDCWWVEMVWVYLTRWLRWEIGESGKGGQ